MLPTPVERREYRPEIAAEYRLNHNVPNPFNPETVISYSIPSPCKVRLTVYDGSGRLTAVLVDEAQEPGFYRVPFNDGRLPAGIYLCRIEAGAFHRTIKMAMTK
jgi:hypothetical protein